MTLTPNHRPSSVQYETYQSKIKQLLMAISPATMGLSLSHQSAAEQDFDLDKLKSMSLDDLVNIEVSIASKTSSRLSDAAAAAYVISSADIKRSSATTIPELLRPVPGLHKVFIISDSLVRY